MANLLPPIYLDVLGTSSSKKRYYGSSICNEVVVMAVKLLHV